MPKGAGQGLRTIFRGVRNLYNKIFGRNKTSINGGYTTEVPPGLVYNPNGTMTWGETAAVTGAIGGVVGGAGALNLVPMIALTSNSGTLDAPLGTGVVGGVLDPPVDSAPVEDDDPYLGDVENSSSDLLDFNATSFAPRKNGGKRRKRKRFSVQKRLKFHN